MKHSKKDQSKIPRFASTLLACSNNSIKGKKHGETQWQRDHWKAMDAKRGAKKLEGHDHSPWMDGRILPILGLPHDDRHLNTALWHQRHRYESTITLACKDEDLQAGPMKATRDFKPITRILTSLRQEKGARQNSFIPKNEGVRQRPFDEALLAELEWMSQNWRPCFSQPFFFLITSSQNWWQHEHQDTQWREHQDTQ